MDKDEVLGLIRRAIIAERQAQQLLRTFGTGPHEVIDTADFLYEIAWEWRLQAFNEASENAAVAYSRAQSFRVARLIESPDYAWYVACNQEKAANWSSLARLAAGVFP